MKTQDCIRPFVDVRPVRDTRSDAMKAQHEREARRHLANAMADVLTLPLTTHLRWLGSTRDLMEAVHITYLDGVLTDEEGRYCTFAYLAARACLLLDRPMPANHRATARRAEARKGIHQNTFIARYARRLCVDKIKQPLREMIDFGN